MNKLERCIQHDFEIAKMNYELSFALESYGSTS